MNTAKKSTKGILIILIAALVAIFAVGVILSLPTRDNGSSDIAVTNTDATSGIVKEYKFEVYVMASTNAKAQAYATKLGIPDGKWQYASTNGMNITNGVWSGMKTTDVIQKFVHLLLPNDITSINSAPTSSPLGINSVYWLSITADTGSNLASITGATSSGSAIKGAYNGGYLERVDLSKATKLTTIPAYTFGNCGRLYDVALPDTITTIGAYGISGNRILHLSLPKSITVSGLDNNAFNGYNNGNGCRKIAEIELPTGASTELINKVKGMYSYSTTTTMASTCLNIYVKGTGRSWLLRTNDGLVFCKNISRTNTLASGTGITTANYTVGRWYMVGFIGTEGGGDTVNASDSYKMTLPAEVDLAKNGANRNGQFDYLDCSGNEIQNDFSGVADIGSNVSGNKIAGGSNTYDIGLHAFYYEWVWHTVIPDNTVSIIGNYAFLSAPMWTFNLGNVDRIGTQSLRFLSRSTGLIFYFPSNNPACVIDGTNSSLGYYGDNATSSTRLIIYRNYASYSSRNTTTGLYSAVNNSALSAGTGKNFSYLMDIVPYVGEYDASVEGNYKYTPITDEKMQRLYTGGLQNYSGGAIYADPFRYVRDASDVWVRDADLSFPALTDYTGYIETNWFTDTDCATKYTESSVGTSTDVTSLRNPSTSNRNEVNMYARKIVLASELTDKVRTYTDEVVNAKSEVITGIPGAILPNYDIQITSYVDSSGAEKTLSSSSIQDAGVYIIQIKPNAAFGKWDAENIPSMTVTVNKAEIDLGDYKIFRLGVTSDTDGEIVTSLRPGKEVGGETAATLYKYGGSWFTEQQTDGTLGSIVEQKEGLWNSFVRAEGDDIKFRLALVTPVIKDAHRNGDVFTCTFQNNEYSQSGEYQDDFVVELKEEAKNNYRLKVTNDPSRGFRGNPDYTFTRAEITKTWYIVKLNNWLTLQGKSGNNAPSYHVPTRWEFGTDPSTLNVGTDSTNQIKFQAPTVALGADSASIGFILELTSKHVVGGNGTLTLSRTGDGGKVAPIPISEYSKYVNSSMPVGDYRIIYSVDFTNGEGTLYEPFQQSFAFTVYDKAFSNEENNAISALNQKVFEYDEKQVPKVYSDNKALFDFDKLNDPNGRLKDMLGMNQETWGSTPRVGEWERSSYNSLFDNNFAVAYNLNRMWNNAYLSLADLTREYPMDAVDVYTVYYQLTCKNRESLVDTANDTRRDYCFYVVVYKTLTEPTIDDITYDGMEILPTVRYENSAFASERSYYSITFPVGQDNVNVNKETEKKKASLTISVAPYEIEGIGSFNLYRFAADGDTPANRKFTQTLQKEYNIIPADNSTTVALYMSGWLWNSEVSADNIIWETRFDNNWDNFTFTLVSNFEDENGNTLEISDISEFGKAPAGRYTLYATCAKEKTYGNWNEWTDRISITISPAVNTWIKSPSISTWTWNQYENFDWDAEGAVSPIQIHAIPTYYTSSTLQEAGSGRFDFRIYSIDENATGNDRYKMVYFDDDETEFHFQFAKGADGEFIKNGSHFVLPIYVAKRLAALDAGQYYLVATVYSANNYSGLNNTATSFLEGAVPFTIGSANNVWSDTITTADWTYSEFELGRHIYTGSTKYETQLIYAIYDKNKTSVISVLGKELKNITDFTAIALTKDGKEYTYADLINMLGVGSYTLTVHGDEAIINERNGINYLAINDERKVSVNKALNTLTETFSVNDFTIGGVVDMTKFTARFDSNKVGYRISKGGRYIDDDTETLTNPIKFATSWDYDRLIKEIAKLAGDDSGRDYTVWYATTEGDNYAAQSGSEVFTVFLGQNDWLDGITPTISGWTYDKTAHAFDKSSISLIHEVEDTLINIEYYDAVSNSESGIIEVGSRLSSCPINSGMYFIRITVPTDSYYTGMSIDLPFQISKADNDFSTLPKINNNGWVYSNLTIADIITGAAKNEEDGMQIQFVVIGDVSGDDETPSVDFRYATLSWMLGSNVDQSNNEILLNAFYSRLNTLDVGSYKMRITLTESKNYNAKTLADVALTVSKAINGWQEGKEPTINSTTKWEWNNYPDSVWKDVATKFGELIIEINDNEVAYSAVSRYLSTLEVGSHKIKFIVNETNNYNGFEEERTFSVTQNPNGWKDGEKDTTAYVDDWTWGEYNNGFAGTGADRKRLWEQPAAKLGTPYATLYKGKDGVGGTLIASDIALYSLDIIMNGLDAGSYYIIWNVAEDKNYKPLTREYINFEVKINDNKWLTAPTMHENPKKQTSGIDYGWTWGTYHDDDGDYFTAPTARYGIVEAKIMKSKTPNIWSDPTVVIEGVSNEVNIDNTLARLDVGRYRIVWKATDPQNTGNYKVIEYKEIEFIVNRGVNAWTDGEPGIESWQWGTYSDDLWQAPTLQSGDPYARIIKLNDDDTYGETVIPKSTPDLLGAQLAQLEVGRYRIIWTADDDDNAEITGEKPEELNFEVIVNDNSWVRSPKILAKDSEWQWNTFTLEYWQRPIAEYYDATSATPIVAQIYRLNDGCDFDYDTLNKKYILDESKCSLVDGITLATIDGINNLSVGKYLIKVSVDKDNVYGRYLGIETILPFTVVPNENKFTSDLGYVNDYAYSEFRGYWGAPTAQYGDVVAIIYRVSSGVRELLFESSIARLNDALKDLHTGTYALDWTIVAENGNYLGGHKITSYFEVEKADNRWTARPTVKDWTWGSYDSSIVPTATPLVSGSEPVYFKIVDAHYEDISSFREYAEKFTKNANGDYYDDGLVLTRDGYFTNIARLEEVVKNLIPGTYHLIAFYPEMEDYKLLNTNNDHEFEIYYAENKWLDLPQIDNWFYGNSVKLPTASAAYGTVKYTYYNAVYDKALGKYRIDGEAISTGENPPNKVGQYILVASTDAMDGYRPLYAEVFFEIYDKYNIAGVSSNLLVWIDIALATIASITAAVIIYQLLKARRDKNDEIFNG